MLKTTNDKSNILINASPLQMLWANSVWRITDSEDVKQLQVPEEIDIQKWLDNEEKKYLIYFDTSQEIDSETEQYKTIYKAEDAIILEKTILNM